MYTNAKNVEENFPKQNKNSKRQNYIRSIKPRLVTGSRSRNEASCGGEDEDLERWEDRALFVEDVIYYTLSWARPRQPFTNGLTRIPCVVGTIAGTEGNAGCRLPLTLGSSDERAAG
ncbi:hypothetical protein TcasGA2_TC002998 [Tribolium castaneum]|uniref:Uncharacterized protein n=1 Tax=Tribolium castaneum TaxID=7070 RepID=D6WGH9_TRICA|nr:hypothetical protein TcasGA2_TC002998 [Tribolium castaneum]